MHVPPHRNTFLHTSIAGIIYDMTAGCFGMKYIFIRALHKDLYSEAQQSTLPLASGHWPFVHIHKQKLQSHHIIRPQSCYSRAPISFFAVCVFGDCRKLQNGMRRQRNTPHTAHTEKHRGRCELHSPRGQQYRRWMKKAIDFASHHNPHYITRTSLHRYMRI